MTPDGSWKDPGVVAGLSLLVVVLATDIVFGAGLVLSGTYGIAAVVTAISSTLARTAFVAITATTLSLVSGLWNDNFGTVDWGTRLLLVSVAAAAAMLIARLRVRREMALQRMTRIAEVAQRSLLRGVPTAIGSVGLAARYVSAAHAARVGGDLYEVSETPYGVRVVVGDVRGKGLDAVQMAGTVLGAYRRASLMQASLIQIAHELDEAVRVLAGEEDFVTVLLAEFHEDHSVTAISCGHPAPLLIGTDGVDLLPIGESAPPLGLAPHPREVTTEWPANTRILIYTDGLIETRDEAGRFFPLSTYAASLSQGTLEEALDGLLVRLNEYAANDIADDVALVLMESTHQAE